MTQTIKTRLMAVLLTLAAVAPVVAAEPEHGAEAANGSGPNLFAGDVGNMIWTLVVFGLVVFVLGKFAWKPILNGLQAREDFIRTSLEEAKADRDAATEALAGIDDKLAEARAEASAIVEEGRRDADVVRQKIEQDARKEADKMVARAKREIDLATQTAVKEIYTKAETLAVEAASKVLEREIDAKDHQRMIEEAIQAIESRDQA